MKLTSLVQTFLKCWQNHYKWRIGFIIRSSVLGVVFSQGSSLPKKFHPLWKASQGPLDSSVDLDKIGSYWNSWIESYAWLWLDEIMNGWMVGSISKRHCVFPIYVSLICRFFTVHMVEICDWNFLRKTLGRCVPHCRNLFNLLILFYYDLGLLFGQ